MDPTLAEQLKQLEPYRPWLTIAAVFAFILLLRVTRKTLRRHIDEIGYRLLRERGLLIWFWLNAPGVILHELSHALVVLLFKPFGFRITSITLFRIKPMIQATGGSFMRSGGRQSLQLGEVQYVRPQGKFTSHIGDGLSAIAPLFGGIAMVMLLYWVATGYNIWEIHQVTNIWEIQQQFLRPGWPWWTLLFAPYLLFTVTSELWPSHQDWRGARWFLIGFLTLITIIIVVLLFAKALVLNNNFLLTTAEIAKHIDFALLMLLALDGFLLIVTYLLVRILVRR